MAAFKEKFHYIPDSIYGLGKLAFNLWWSWHPESRMLFKVLDRVKWKLSVHNPVKIMKETMVSVGALFSARRMVKEYVSKFYQSALNTALE